MNNNLQEISLEDTIELNLGDQLIDYEIDEDTDLFNELNQQPEETLPYTTKVGDKNE